MQFHFWVLCRAGPIPSEVRLRACLITQDKRNDSVGFVLATDHVECEVRLGVHYLPVTALKNVAQS
jgi:hypothetical protein